MPTIRELAETCGASKPTVKRRLQDLGLWEGHVNKSGSVFIVDDFAASAVASSFAQDGKDVEPPVPSDSLSPVVASLERHISSLERQLDAKDAQISALVNQNSELSARLDGMASRIAELSEQVGRAVSAAERPHGLLDRLLGPGK